MDFDNDGEKVALKTLYDGTTVTADKGQLTRVEQFSFTDNVNSNGFSIVEAASKKRADRKLQVVTSGEQVSIDGTTKKLKTTLKGTGNIQVNGTVVQQVGRGDGLSIEEDKLKYTTLYTEGDAVKFTPSDAS